MTDIQILYENIISEKDIELNVKEELKDEYAFFPYVNYKAKHVDYGDVELQNRAKDKEVTPSNPLLPSGGGLPKP